MAASLAVDWDAIKDALIAGVEQNQVALAHGLVYPDGSPDTRAIRKRASREQWAIPTAIVDRARRKATIASASARNASRAAIAASRSMSQVSQDSVTVSQFEPLEPPDALELAAGEMLRYGQQASLLASRIAVTSLRRADPDLPLESIADIKTAMSIARTAAGMDKAVTAVQVNVWGGQGQAKSNEEWCDE